jgi:cellobiose phosphorylase
MSLQYRDTTLGKLSDEAPLLLPSDLERIWPPAKVRGPFQYPHSHETDNIYPIAHYVVESGDLAFLDQRLPFLDGGHGTVFDHICLALQYAVQGLSERSLPKFCTGFGDWNDELNGVCSQGKAESVMMAMELCYHLRECASLARRYGRTNEASQWMETYARIKDACNRYAWDGNWYIRAFADGGPTLRPIGTSKDREGRIYLETQSWAVLSGVAEGDRTRQCMESVAKYLVSPYGPMLLAPAYTQVDPQVGMQSAYAPGWRNANVYFRPAGWAVMAACLADLPDLAFEMYKKASLSELSKDIRRYLREPYVYAENVNGPDHPFAGAAQYQWNLGEGANWMWRSYVYYILGVRPVFEGLLIDPKIPAGWPGFSVNREFRNARYEIVVKNPNRATSGVNRMLVDGAPVVGAIVPAFADGNSHKVEVTLGAN